MRSWPASGADHRPDRDLSRRDAAARGYWRQETREANRKSLLSFAGLPPLPFHHLRHTFETLAFRGLDPAPVQTLLGHSKITTTERYLHARPLNELAERMDSIFAVAPPISDPTAETAA